MNPMGMGGPAEAPVSINHLIRLSMELIFPLRLFYSVLHNLSFRSYEHRGVLIFMWET